MRVSALVLGALVLINLPAYAGDDYQDDVYVSCGDKAEYGSVPLFKLEYINWEQALVAGATMGVTHFVPRAGGGPPNAEELGCRVTQLETRGQTLTAGNPTQNCGVEITPIAGSAQVQVKWSTGEIFTDCTAADSLRDIAAKLAASDPNLAFKQSSYAISDSGAAYDAQMNAIARPAYKQGIDGTFPGLAGVSIAYKIWEVPNEKGAVVLLPGRGDAYATFAETIYDLTANGYSVYAMDERGQGASGPLLANPKLGYVEHFEDYVTDLKSFVTTVVNRKPHARKFLLAHSMGGAIGAKYASEYGPDFTAYALVAPMLKIDPAPFTMTEAELLDWIELFIGLGEKYAPGQGDYDPNGTFAANTLTTSEPRWTNLNSTMNANPKLQVGGPTIRWVHEALEAGQEIHDNAASVTAPILLLTAGNDKFVDVPEQAYFCGQAKHCTQAPVYAQSMHNILAEQDAVRGDALARIFAFFAEFPAAATEAKPQSAPSAAATETSPPEALLGGMNFHRRMVQSRMHF